MRCAVRLHVWAGVVLEGMHNEPVDWGGGGHLEQYGMNWLMRSTSTCIMLTIAPVEYSSCCRAALLQDV